MIIVWYYFVLICCEFVDVTSSRSRLPCPRRAQAGHLPRRNLPSPRRSRRLIRKMEMWIPIRKMKVQAPTFTYLCICGYIYIYIYIYSEQSYHTANPCWFAVLQTHNRLPTCPTWGISDAAERKRVHSRAYDKARKAARLQGLDEEPSLFPIIYQALFI